jgi:stalled ribosome alternative rescue factor ArfA
VRVFGLGVDEKGAAACAALISALFRQRKEARKAVD